MHPELVTVAANFGPAATFIPVTFVKDHNVVSHSINMPASMMGWLILNNLVKGVQKTGSEDGIMSGELRRTSCCGEKYDEATVTRHHREFGIEISRRVAG